MALPTGNGSATFADLRRVAVVQQLDRLVELRRAGRGLDLRVAGLRATQSNVVVERPGKQERFLKHDADVVAHRLSPQAADIMPIEQHRPNVRIVGAHQQAEQRAFAGATRPDDADAPTGFDFQANFVKAHLVGLRIREAHSVHHDFAA